MCRGRFPHIVRGQHTELLALRPLRRTRRCARGQRRSLINDLLAESARSGEVREDITPLASIHRWAGGGRGLIGLAG